MPGLEGKVVLLTGASSGIGWAAALRFAEEGVRLAVCARRKEKLEELAKLVRAKGAECLPLACDVADRASVRKALDEVLERWGRVDVLVNNAGVNEYARFVEQDYEEAEGIVRTNLLGAMDLLQRTLRVMLKQGDGHVVNVASIAGLRGMPYMAAYSASKFALVGLTEALRVELRGTGVTLSAFLPGSAATPMADKLLDRDPFLKRWAPVKSADAMARQIVRLARNRAPERVYGEAPGFLLKLLKLSPRLMDLVIHLSTKPMARLIPSKAPKA